MMASEIHVLIYDGSFDGFLTCVFQVYEQKLPYVNIQNTSNKQAQLFGNQEEVVTDINKSKRVWNGLKKKTSTVGQSRLVYAFLSELEGVENLLLNYIRYAFHNVESIDSDFGNPEVLKVTQIAKSVAREKHRMEAFVRFRLTKDGIYFATVEPDFNVLPLIQKHFKKRYADQKWLIYDLKRQYALFYDLNKIDLVYMELPAHFNPTKTSEDYFSNEELEFQTLWQDYFKSTNIESRKNMKLHVRHVPKRYWKYLSEKLP